MRIFYHFYRWLRHITATSWTKLQNDPIKNGRPSFVGLYEFVRDELERDKAVWVEANEQELKILAPLVRHLKNPSVQRYTAPSGRVYTQINVKRNN